MRKNVLFYLILCICLVLCACEKAETAPAEMVTVSEITTVETIGAITQPPTEPATIPPTNPPRVTGPDRIDGNSIIIENVSVEFAEEIPRDIKSSISYSSSSFKDEFVLDSSQQYAEIHFTVTNRTDKEIKIADIHDDFLVELVFDNRYIYSPDSDSWCFFKAGGQVAVVSDMSSIGSVSLDPLSTKDVVTYIPCAREVANDLDKYLLVVFSSNHGGFESLEFIIR